MKKLLPLLFSGIVFFTFSVFGEGFRDNINRDFKVPTEYQNYVQKATFVNELTEARRGRTTMGYHFPDKNGIDDGLVDVLEVYQLVKDEENGGMKNSGKVCILYDFNRDGSFKDENGKYYAKGDCDW